MNKYSVITIIAILIIISPFAYSGMNIVGAEQLQYKWSDSEKFSFFAMMVIAVYLFIFHSLFHLEMKLFFHQSNIVNF